jgi:hypothetical protein
LEYEDIDDEIISETINKRAMTLKVFFVFCFERTKTKNKFERFSSTRFQFFHCTEVLSDLSLLKHVKDLSITFSYHFNLFEMIIDIGWAHQLKWLKVRMMISFFHTTIIQIIVCQ